MLENQRPNPIRRGFDELTERNRSLPAGMLAARGEVPVNLGEHIGQTCHARSDSYPISLWEAAYVIRKS